jgi:hypothetical protein
MMFNSKTLITMTVLSLLLGLTWYWMSQPGPDEVSAMDQQQEALDALLNMQQHAQHAQARHLAERRRMLEALQQAEMQDMGAAVDSGQSPPVVESPRATARPTGADPDDS